MNKHLVIVESAGKINKISEYLGSNYIVKASFGHCMDLDPKSLSIDVNDNYKPTYIISEGKHKTVNELVQLTSKCKSVILATDNDREGEAIGWSLSKLLKLHDPDRIIFTEITKKAITSAIENPKKIDMNMVYAQQARRLLDRLVGYKISPILQSNLNNKDAKSAGRVQSVLVKIINDKEKEIVSTINSSYLKTTCELSLDSNKLNGVLMKGNDIFKFDNTEEAIAFLNKINKNTIFKIINIQNKISIRNPPPPYITSSLQQEASTRLKFNVKKTMDVAQKLYEGGYITYMRTDSTNLSNDAINSCKQYIINKFGDKYSKPTQYKSSNHAQEAHEAIRPTNINIDVLNVNDNDQIRLYNLIWKRTICSQMQPAQINIQSISIDTLNNNKSILNKSIWLSNTNSIIFDGFLIINNDTNEDSEQMEETKYQFNINDILNLNKIKITEEYTKFPLRFNEANLVKYLEKNNIGRPSTYATLINKIIERNYVEIKDIDGFKKESKIIELDKKYKIKELFKEVIIGKENKKIVPTELGVMVTDFLETNFNEIMQIDFTSDFESYLDKIAESKATWINVLDLFYKKFNPIVEKLSVPNKNGDKLLGLEPNNNYELFVGTGKYGPYIKYMLNNKYKYIAIEDINITLEEAIQLFKYPKLIGNINKLDVELFNGKFGLYLKYNNKNYSIPEKYNDNLTIEDAIEIIQNKKNKEFKIKDKIIYIKNGQYGPYLQIKSSNNKVENISIPKNIDINTINIANILEIIANKKKY